MPSKVNKAPFGPTQSITHTLHPRTCWEGTAAPTSRNITALASNGRERCWTRSATTHSSAWHPGLGLALPHSSVSDTKVLVIARTIETYISPPLWCRQGMKIAFRKPSWLTVTPAFVVRISSKHTPTMLLGEGIPGKHILAWLGVNENR